MANSFFYAPDIDEYFETIQLVFCAEIVGTEKETKHIDFVNEISGIRWVSLNELDKYDLKPLSYQSIKQLGLNQ